MKKFNLLIFSLLTFVLMTSCDNNNKLRQADAENTIKEFVKSYYIEGGESCGQQVLYNVKSIAAIEPIIQFDDTEASSVVHFYYKDVSTECRMHTKFNFKRSIDKKWVLISIDEINYAGTQIASDKLKKWLSLNIIVQKAITEKKIKAGFTSDIRYFLQKKVKDADGNVYKTVKIGTQVWMTENLKTMKYNDGTDIPNIKDNNIWTNLTTPGYCWYNNDATNKNTLGALYNWYTVNTGKLAPKGWHVPTDDEWTILINYLIANGYNYDGTTTGNEIAKSLAATSGWSISESSGDVGNDLTKNNTTGFTGIPGGCRSKDGEFNGIGGDGDGEWWSSSEGVFFARGYGIGSGSDLYDFEHFKQLGLSVRCVKDK